LPIATSSGNNVPATKPKRARGRLAVRKTYKLFIGGKFVRTESGRILTARSGEGADLDNYSHASRKDFRDAVVAARAAFDGWAKSSAYLRGQILYRAAEILEARQDELKAELARSVGVSSAKARAEVTASIDRLVHFAGWTDKLSQVFGSVNPVSSPHFNFTIPEPTGVVTIVAPDEPPLLAMISLLAPVILTGNTAVVIASEKHALPALTFAEIVATSDIPPGVVNMLGGRRKELAPHVAGHFDVNAIIDGSGDRDGALAGGTAVNLKRYAARTLAARDWFTRKAEDPYWILDTIEFKTAWHPIGL
jgi:acyl-CoA reductase-like NAD-dependent aldehyde dehydrogenase